MLFRSSADVGEAESVGWVAEDANLPAVPRAGRADPDGKKGSPFCLAKHTGGNDLVEAVDRVRERGEDLGRLVRRGGRGGQLSVRETQRPKADLPALGWECDWKRVVVSAQAHL